MYRDLASGADRHLDITFRLQVVESSSLVSVLLEKHLASLHLLFSFTSGVFFCYIHRI